MKRMLVLMLLLGSVGLVSGCASWYGGKVHPSQKRRPLPGEPKRKLRWGMLAADLLGLQLALYSIPVDFLTKAIYRPILPDSTRRRRIELNQKQKKYLSVGTNLLPLIHNSAEFSSEIRFHPAFGIHLSALRTWGAGAHSIFLKDDGVRDRLTTGWSGQVGLRWYPVATFSPEVRSNAEFYFGTDVVGTTFEQQALVPEEFGTTQVLVEKRDGDRFLGYALSYGTLLRLGRKRRIDLDGSLQYSGRFSQSRDYLNSYLPGLGFESLGASRRIRFGVALRYRF